MSKGKIHLTRTFIALALLISAAFSSFSVGAQEKLNVVTTTGMIADIVQNIGGDLVNVTALMGPGVDPHLYRATAGDIRTLSDANVIFYNGLHLEGKMAEIFERLSGKIPTFAVAESIPEGNLLDFAAYPGSFDPHIWFDVSFWTLAVEATAKGLSEVDPNNAATYEANAATYIETLTQLDEYTKTAIESIPEGQRLMITAHDAFQYYGSRYGIEVTGLQGISTEAEAGAQDVQRLVDLIVERQVPAIFVESSVPRRTIEAVQEASKARGWDVKIGGTLFSDAMGDTGTPEGTYIGMVLYNNTVIVTSLGGKMPELPEALADYAELVEQVEAIVTQ